MNDSKAATEFIALLPMTLTLEDYVGKVSDLPKRLSTAGSPDGTKASIGDIISFLSRSLPILLFPFYRGI